MIPSTSELSNTIGDIIGTSLNNTLGRVLYAIVSAVNWFVSIVYQIFEVFSGQMKVSYNGEYTYLTNVFFENSTISGVYWGMAIIGVVLCFAFTIISVIRKMFDGSDKVQVSLGTILGSMFKSILLILSLNVIMVVTLNFSNVLMQRVVYVFNAGASLTEAQEIDFTDEQFATMGRVLNTIGNYSLNPSYNSRYNLNSCFNEVRGDLQYLQKQGVFDFYYQTKDANGNEVKTWQSELQKLVFAANLEEELKMDVYNESVSNAMLDIMATLRTNTAFYPLDHYERAPVPMNNIPFDRMLFLSCTYNAALNEQFNINPSNTDPLRGPYYNGEKNIYDVVQVSKDFNLVWGFNYIMFFLIVYGIMKEMMYILLDCIARIYNMVLLYLVAPPFIAISPLDGGGKMKQWTTAFVVQCFGVFGTVITMRLMLTLAPIVVGTELELFSNAIMDIYAKNLIIYAGTLACRKANGLITGILADNSGWQSISASNLRTDHNEKKQKDETKAEKKKNEKERENQKKAEAAKSAAKLAAGSGDLKDMKNVGQAVKEQKEESMEKAGLGGADGNSSASGESKKADDGGQADGRPDGNEQPEKANLAENQADNNAGEPPGGDAPDGNGNAENMRNNFGNDQADNNTGNQDNNAGNQVNNAGNQVNNGGGNDGGNGGGNGGGAPGGIPVAPDINRTPHYIPPAPQQNQQAQAGQEQPARKAPPPPRDNNQDQ